MKNSTNTLKLAEDIFAKIMQQHPNLETFENVNDPVEISITIPIQQGLKHKVWMCLQNNDELHFSVGNFWCEWFPCTNSEKVQEYISAVDGFLSGSHRILEHTQWGRCVKAELQRPSGNKWETIGLWRTFYLPIPWGWETHVLLNE